MVIIYIIGGVAGFLCSTIAGYVQYQLQVRLPLIGAGAFTVGASAPIFGLLGGLMYYSRRGGSSLIRSAVMGYVMSAVVMGVLMRGIDNWAHAGGFAGGYLAGIWLDPLKPERTDHMIIAAGCLVASAVAIAASLIVSLWPMIMIRFFGAPPAIIGLIFRLKAEGQPRDQLLRIQIDDLADSPPAHRAEPHPVAREHDAVRLRTVEASRLVRGTLERAHGIRV